MKDLFAGLKVRIIRAEWSGSRNVLYEVGELTGANNGQRLNTAWQVRLTGPDGYTHSGMFREDMFAVVDCDENRALLVERTLGGNGAA